MTSPGGTVKPKIFSQINAYLDWCRDVRGYTPATMHGKTWMLRDFASRTGIDSISDITNDVVDRFVSILLKRKINPLVINLRISVILSFTKWAKDARVAEAPLKPAYVKKLKGTTARPRVFYTREEIDRVLDMTKDEMTWLLISLSFDTGMRLYELTNLKKSEIHGARINFVGKGKKSREVWISARTCERLEKWLEKSRPGEWVWENGAGYPYSDETLRTRMADAFHAAGHYDFHPHALRHSFATDIQKRGADIMEIKEMMGHTNVATTQRYMHGFEGQMRNLFAKYRDPKIADLEG